MILASEGIKRGWILRGRDRAFQHGNGTSNMAWLNRGWSEPRQTKLGQRCPQSLVLSCSLEAIPFMLLPLTVTKDSLGNCQSWYYRKLFVACEVSLVTFLSDRDSDDFLSIGCI